MDAPEEPQPPVVYTMENKPIVTCAGDQNLFTSIYPTLSQQLPREPMEWRRSYGRAPKMIHLESNFVQFKEELLPKEGNKALLTFPFLHIYWTECCDTEVYKATVKDDLTKWQNVLKAHSSVDWLIVVVENDAKKKNKTNILPRTSIVDKIRNDFCNKQSDRCVVLSDPLKDSSRTQESWNAFLTVSLKPYTYEFQVENFFTLYSVRAEILPASGAEYCKTGSLCSLEVSITRLADLLDVDKDEALVESEDYFSTKLMYEVVDNSSNWAVCGKSCGVIAMPLAAQATHRVHMEVMPLFAGYLPLPDVRLFKYLPHHSAHASQLDADSWIENDSLSVDKHLDDQLDCSSLRSRGSTARWPGLQLQHWHADHKIHL